MSESAQRTFQDDLLTLLDETFERHHGIFLDKGTSLFETIDAIDAARASRRVGPDSGSLAAHVDHVRFYFDVVEAYWLGRPPEKVDWKHVWQTTREVTPERWDAIRAGLRASYARVRGRLEDHDAWPPETHPADVMAFVVHTAYHLGAIRQILHAPATGR